VADSTFRRLVRGTFFYTLLGFLPLAARFVLFPVFVRYLSPFDYGLISLTNTLTAALTIFAVFGLESAFGLYYFSYRRTPQLLRTYFSTILTSVLVIGLVLVLLGQWVGPAVIDALFKDPAFAYAPFGQIAVLVAITTAVNSLVLSYYRSSQQPERYFVVAVASFLLSTAAEAVAILVLQQGAMGVLVARLIGAAVVALLVIGYVYATGGMRFSWRMLSRSLAYGLPILVYLFFGFVYNSYDRVLIENFLSVPQVAVFSTAFTIASIVEVFLQAIQAATYPAIFEAYKRDPAGNADHIDRLIRLQGWAMLFIGIGILAASPLFIHRFTRPEYLPALPLIPWLLVGFLMRFFYVVWTTPLFFIARYTRQLPWLNVVCGLAVVGFNLLLLPPLGLVGAALAMVLARGVQLAVTAMLYYRQQQVRFSLRLQPVVYVAAMAYLLAIALFPIEGLWPQTAAYALPLVLLTGAALVIWQRALGWTLRPDWSRLKAYL